jgi:rod shape-determining protein MreD
MRWITFFILLYLMTALQDSHLGGIPYRLGAGWTLWPYIEFLPLLAIFYALYAADTAAPLAALLCGLAYDFRAGPGTIFIGTNLIPLAIVGWLIVRIRLSIFREHFIAQVVITLLAVVVFAILSAFFSWAIGAPLEGHTLWAHLTHIAGNAIYTSIVAPFLFYVLFRFQHLLGFTPHGPRLRGHG